MSHKALRIVSLSLFLAIIILLPAWVFGAENATITGDEVRMRTLPTATGSVLVVKSLDKGTRVEALRKTNFTDTIDEYTAPWYRIAHGVDTGYVFGRYVAPDAGVTINVMDRASEPYIVHFVNAGLRSFGATDAEIIKRLGEPVSINKYKGAGIFEDLSYHRLVYEDISFEMSGQPGGGGIWALLCTSDSYEFGGLRVGSMVADVKRLLGEPTMTNDVMIRYQYNAGGDTPDPYRKEGDIFTYYEALNAASFRIVDGRVTEIALYNDAYD
ncbi:MAG: hypothetical protein JW765_05915 [Deltaproteobacteria bacterium]|nr:hypothetical protein [Candidatus Zymogenaceae bacterium]